MLAHITTITVGIASLRRNFAKSTRTTYRVIRLTDRRHQIERSQSHYRLDSRQGNKDDHLRACMVRLTQRSTRRAWWWRLFDASRAKQLGCCDQAMHLARAVRWLAAVDGYVTPSYRPVHLTGHDGDKA